MNPNRIENNRAQGDLQLVWYTSARIQEARDVYGSRGDTFFFADGIISCHSYTWTTCKKTLQIKYEVTDLGAVNQFLGFEIQRHL